MGDPSAVARMPEHLDVFRVADDGRVLTAWWHQGSDWSGWRSIGGFFPSGAKVSVVSRNRDHLDLFVTGNDGRVYTSWWHQGSDWSGVRDSWRSIGGFFPPGAPVTVVSRNPDHLDLFVTGNDGRVYTSWWHAGSEWSGLNNTWRSIGGFFPPGTQISAVARNPDHLDLFVTGNDGRVYTSWWHAGNEWSGLNNTWSSVGGFFPRGAPVSVVSRNPDHLDLFVCGNDGRVYTSWWHAGQPWSGANNSWTSLGGFFPAAAPVTALARNPDHLDVFVCGNDGRVYTSWWHAGQSWSGVNDSWMSIGGFFPKGTTVWPIARNPDHLDLFIRGNDGQIWSEWWHQGQPWSGQRDSWFVIPPSVRLSFTMERQTQNNWCWAATSKSVAQYYDPATTWTQCSIANGEKGQTTCCTNGMSAACDQYGTLDTSLARVGHYDRTTGQIGYWDVRQEMLAGRPLGARTAWSGGGAHFVCIIGALPGGMYAIDDPISGKSDVSEAAFKSSYLNSGTWTHTYYTR